MEKDNIFKARLGLLLSGIILAAALFITIAVIVGKFKHQDAESSFTPEQKAVLQALRVARVDLENAKAELEKTKKEVTEAIQTARATQGLDPNVTIGWQPHGVNGTYACKNDEKRTPVWLGFRSDHFVMWKYADE